MDVKDKLTPLGVSCDAGLLEDDTLRDPNAELERARAEFRLGHLAAATKLVDDLAAWLKPRLNCPARTAIYAASRVLDARIHEQRKQPEPRAHALAEAMEAFGGVVSQLEAAPQAFGDYGISLEMLGRHQEAAHWLQTARDKKLDSWETLHYLGMALKALGSPEAVGTLQEAERRNPEDRAATVALAEVLAGAGDGANAAEAYWRASVSALRHEDHEEALRYLEEASRLRAENCKDIGLRAVILSRLGRNSEALRLIERAIDMIPPDLVVMGQLARPAAWRVKGRILLQMQQWQDALDAFAKANEGQPGDPVALAGEAKALMHLDRWQDALERLDRAEASDRGNPELLADRAVILHHLGPPEDALATAERAVKMAPNLAYAQEVYGGLLQQAGKFEESVSCFREMLALDPSRIEAWLKTSEALRLAGRPEEALQILDRAVDRLRPAALETAQLQAARGETLAEMGELAGAADAFRQSYAAGPDAAGLGRLVDMLRHLHDHEAALAIIEDYLGRHAEVPDGVLVRKAQLLSDAGEFAQAYETLRPIRTESAWIYIWRGWGLENQGRAFGERALAEYHRACQLEPSNVGFKCRVANVLRLTGQAEAASAIYAEVASALGQRQGSLSPYELWLLGWCHLGQRCWGEAIRYLTAVVASDTDVSARFDLALAFLCDGRRTLAEEQYKDSIATVQRKCGPAQRGIFVIAIQDLSVTAELEPEIKEASDKILKTLRDALEQAPHLTYQQARIVAA